MEEVNLEVKKEEKPDEIDVKKLGNELLKDSLAQAEAICNRRDTDLLAGDDVLMNGAIDQVDLIGQGDVANGITS